MRGTATLLAAIAVSGGCGGETITIELDEVNGSGITGFVELRAVGDAATRMTVTEVDGGTITGARVVSHSTCPAINDRYAITPPTGIIHVPFEVRPQ